MMLYLLGYFWVTILSAKPVTKAQSSVSHMNYLGHMSEFMPHWYPQNLFINILENNFSKLHFHTHTFSKQIWVKNKGFTVRRKTLFLFYLLSSVDDLPGQSFLSCWFSFSCVKSSEKSFGRREKKLSAFQIVSVCFCNTHFRPQDDKVQPEVQQK